MALTTQDLVKGTDFTGISPVTGADLNVLVDNAVPADSIGLVLSTTDSALNTPVVPNPNAVAGQNKWKKYVWNRTLHSSAATHIPKLYAWDDNATSVATYLKWSEITVDTTQIEADISTALSKSAAALAAANNALAVANNASTVANNALTTANGLNDSVNQAIANAATALSTANDALTAANEAKALAASALTAANTPKSATNALVPGTAFQQLRTNSSATGVEWFSQSESCYRASEQKPKNTNMGANVVGQNVRQFNVEDNATSWAVLDGTGGITLLAGTYRISARIVGNLYNSHRMQAFVQDDSDVVLISGQSIFLGGGNDDVPCASFLDGFLFLDSAKRIRLTDYRSAVPPSDIGLGKAANVGPGSHPEVYSVVSIVKM